jgi:hypothetical protein
VAIHRLSKFDRTGKFMKATGQRGSAPGEFIQPHALAFDSKGRLFVADRSNNRIQIYDQDLNLLDTGWAIQPHQRLWIERTTRFRGHSGPIRGADAPDWKRGIRIGSIKDGRDGKVQFFIPDPSQSDEHDAAEGIAVDAAGVTARKWAPGAETLPQITNSNRRYCLTPSRA